ncbi:hypothetical protein AQJ43_14745 [Streptomyces avermitilis]|uniref:Secreted protein n=2 Tax=Streptomyces avermitilis TaxID=33903 RepID=Q82B46_STRAW|nr:hypothetical protein [Streptomyces avermitilis]MYT01423.1 hypothetical protein [Streptomyces sp. SID5469]KUN54567.1 hypothetical protein AQJ43_14745 [Streptomyces avermitilis]OOV27957.1 hypothetical protein SM007_18270 [Streptomyces avermitilis]BAC73571.1 putative secreted protein [Streptomyces avermitilis MA-4680 = NBRC 14893]GDY66065.1 hypothetical protein SAV14893_054580 [Streptomyces avermitilis]
MPVPIRRLIVALTLCCTLFVGATACGSDSTDQQTSAAAATATPTGTSSAEKQKFAKTRFVANAGLAAGATYQWIVKPWKAGKFKKGAKGRKVALVKAGLAGGFSYNRLKAALKNAQGDPTLAKAVAPLTAGIEALKSLPAKLRKGDSTDAAANTYDDIINKVKDAGKSAGAEVKDQVPSASELTKG